MSKLLTQTPGTYIRCGVTQTGDLATVTPVLYQLGNEPNTHQQILSYCISIYDILLDFLTWHKLLFSSYTS